MSERYGAFVVPEVNALFQRPADESPLWYLERQQERLRIAAQQQETHALVILDGDPFQPLWYNWTFGFERWQSLEALSAFYRPLIVSGELTFPNRYILLTAGEQELRKRKEVDTTRTRRGFETHLILRVTLPRYFAAMEAAEPGLVLELESQDAEATVTRITDVIKRPLKLPVNPLTLFDGMVAWLAQNRP